jgi:polar amino acid transport system substrate-binding protein
MAVQLLRASGCAVVGIDVDPIKIDLARELGCNLTIHARDDSLEEQIITFTGGYGVDATIITAGTSSNGPVEQAGEITREKGRVVVVGATGLTLPREPYYHKEIDFRISRSYGPGRYDPSYEEEGQDYPFGYVRFTERRNMECFLDLLKSGHIRLDKIITHRFAFDDAPKAYDLIGGERREPYLGILLEYTRSEAEISRRVDFKPTVVNRDKLTIGVIGAGNYATSYLLPHLRDHPAVKLGAICTGTGISASQTAQRFGFESADSDAAFIIKNSDAIVVATRHNDHADFAIQALRQGKPVFVEKPLVINDEQLAEVLATASEAREGSVVVGFNRRFAPCTELLKKHFVAAKSPKQILIRVNAGAILSDHWVHNPKVGGGRLIGEGCHFVDLAVALTGSLIESVHAMAIDKPNTEHAVLDNFTIQLKHADGSISAIIYTAVGDVGLAKERIEMSGGGLSGVIDDFQRVELWKNGKASRQSFSTQDKGQSAEIAAWLAGLKQGRSSIPLAEIANVHQACLGAIRSLRDRTVVAL